MNPRDTQVDAMGNATVPGMLPPKPTTMGAEAAMHGWQEADVPVGAPPRPMVVAGTRGAGTAKG